MNPLKEVEGIVFDVESLPTYLIYDIFVVEPNTHSVKSVDVFMYGNGVPIEKAVDCFMACIGMDSFYITCALRDWYSMWDKILILLIKHGIIPRL